jgi:autotransporter-associated beta strand protein
MTPSAITVNNSAKNYAIQAQIAGAAGITKTGTGSLTNSGANTYTGPTVINQGNLVAGVASVANVSGALGNNSAVTLANDATAALVLTNNASNYATQIGSLAGGGAAGGNVLLGSAILTEGGDNSSTTYAGTISGAWAGGLTKIGTGTQTFSGTNNYSGVTTVSAGALTFSSGAVVNTSSNLMMANVAGVTATVNINDTSSVAFGPGVSYIGYLNGNGILNLNSGLFNTAGELRVGGSDSNGSGISGTGLLNVSGGTVNVSALTVGRGNNNVNSLSGTVTVSGGTLTSTNDLVLGYAGASFGKLAITGTGTVNVGTTAVKWLQVGEWDTTKAELDITNGSLNLMTGTSIKMNTQNTPGPNVVNQMGGSVTFYADAGGTAGGGGVIDLQTIGVAASTNTYNLNGGILTVPQIISTATTGTRIFNFNGGTIRAVMGASSYTNFMNLGKGSAVANVRNGGAMIDNQGNYFVMPQSLTHSTIAGDAAVDGGLTASGPGTLTLSGTNTYTGPTVVSNGSFVVISGNLAVINKQGAGTLTIATNNVSTNSVVVGAGTLALSVSNCLSGAPSITVSNGAILDVTALSASGGYTLLSGQSLLGNGTVSGTINMLSGAKIYAGADGAYGTNTIDYLALVSGAVACYDLSATYNGANDLIVANSTLTNNGAIYINAPSSLVNLDTSHDYVLMTAGSLYGTVSSTPIWGVQPLNWKHYTVIQSGNNILLHYTESIPPTVTATASPATLVRNQSTLITATVTPGIGTITGVTLDASSIGLSASLPLVLSGVANVYTNTITVPAATSLGLYSVKATVSDSIPLTGSADVALTVVANIATWNGGGTDQNWDTNPNWAGSLAPGYVGDSLVFAGTANTSPDMDQYYTVTGIIFSNNAASFNISSAEGDTLTLTGSGAIVNNSANAQTLNVGIMDAGGGLTKSGNGTVILAGDNYYTGPTIVSAGTLTVSGAVENTAITTVGNAAGNAVLMKTGYGSITTSNLFVGNFSNSVGAFYHNSGQVTVNGGTGDLLDIGNAPGAFGYYASLGGIVYANGIAVGGENNNGTTGFSGTGGNGVMEINGGSVSDSGWFVMARGLTTEAGVLNVFNGSLQYNGGGIADCWGTNGQTGIINIMGGIVANDYATMVGINLNYSGNATNTGILNLNGGTVLAASVKGTAARVNFNGGTLQASSNNPSFMSGLGGINVYSGGATINDYGYAISVSQGLLAPAGNGVNGIASFTGGAGYIASPIVLVVPGAGDTTGVGATAIAQVDLSTGGATSGQVTNVLITCPGVNYTAAPTFTLIGGGATTAATITGQAPTANSSGSFTKTGGGTLLLGGSSTYTGDTVISGGTLQLASDALLHLSFDNITNDSTGTNIVVINDGVGGSSYNGMVYGTATIVSGGRYGKALSIPAGVATNAYVVVSNAVQAMTISNTTWTVGMWLKTTTAGAAYFYQGTNGWGSGNTEFYLENGTAADGAGTHAGGVRWGQGWESGTAVINDGSWHFVVMTCTNGTKAMYVDGALDALTIDQWTGTGTGINLRIGGAAPGADSQIALGGLIDEFYMYNRALSLSEVQSLYSRNSSGAPVLPASTAANVASGSALDVGGVSQTVSSLTGSGNLIMGDTAAAAGTFAVGTASDLEFDGVISGLGAGSFTKVGTGTLTLTGTSTYSGTTTVSNGTLMVSGSIAGTANVTANGTLRGLGSLGSVIVSGNLSAGNNSTLGTLTVNSNLTFASGGIATFNLTTSAAGSNAKIVVNGYVTNNNNVIHLKAPSTSVNLDTADYVLIDNAAGLGISGGFVTIPVWDVKPLNSVNYTIKNNGSGQIVLHYSVATPPTAGIAVSPSTVSRNQGSLITVTVTNGSTAITTVTLDASQMGGSSALALHQVGSTSVYTNTIAAPASYNPGTYSITATVNDAAGLLCNAGTNLTVTLANDVWTGAGTDDFFDTNPNWGNSAAPGYIGDGLVFAGTTRLTPSLDTNYTVTSVTFSNNAGSFNIGTANGSTLTLTNGDGVVNNSANAQSLNVPVAFTVAGTVNAASGDVALGQTVTNGNYLLMITGTHNTALNGVISGSGGLTKTGNGTLTMVANNTFSGSVDVRAGTLAIPSGSVAPNATVTVSDTTSNKAVLNISGGTLSAAGSSSQFNSSLLVGAATNAAGALKLGAGGNLTVGQQFGLGTGVGGYADFDMSGGTATLGSYLVVAFNNDYSVFNMSGGSLTIQSNLMTIGAGGTASVGVANLSGGTLTSTATNGYTIGGIFVGENGTGTLNVSGTANLALSGYGLTIGRISGASGTVNLLGGTVTTTSVGQGAGSALLNFNGGTLQARSTNLLAGLSMTNDTFMTNLSSAYVYSGGAKLDTTSNYITISTPLIAPSGYGVNSISLSSGGTGYIAAPVVMITGGTGSGATATALVDPTAGVVTNILVSNPGSGYASGDTLTVTFTGGGGSGVAANTPVLAADIGGGLTKLGTGVLTLTGASTYTGNTVITNGTLALGTGGSLANSASINVCSNTTFDVSANSFTLGSGQTLKGYGTVNGSVINNGTIAPGNSIGTLAVEGNLTLQSAGAVAVELNADQTTSDKLTVSGAVNYGGTLAVTNLAGTLVKNQQFTLFSAGSFTGNFTSIIGSAGTGLAYSFNPTNGVLSVVTGSIIASNPTNITATVNGNTLSLTWPADHLGWILQSQTNSLTAGLGTNWVDVAGSAAATNNNVTINPASPSVFFRLRHP